MAERRMFAKTIVDSDAFLDMPAMAQLLYFHLGMRARDKGLINNVKSIAKVLGADPFEVDALSRAGYIRKSAEDDEYTIVHWYENNGIGETAKKRNNYSYRKWREDVLKRSLYECEMCGSGFNLQAHHIKHFSQYPALRFDPDNGMCLCAKCHKELHERERMDGRCEMD